MSEHEFQNQVRKELTNLGYISFRTNVGKVKMHDGRWFDTGLPVGFSDLIILKDGKTYFIELKVGKNKPSKNPYNINEIRAIPLSSRKITLCIISFKLK